MNRSNVGTTQKISLNYHNTYFSFMSPHRKAKQKKKKYAI